MPAQDFLFDMCAPTQPGQQNSPWPVRVDDLCATFQLNDPNKNKQACEIMGLLKLMLASPSAAPLKCQPDGVPPPPETDQQGGREVYLQGVQALLKPNDQSKVNPRGLALQITGSRLHRPSIVQAFGCLINGIAMHLLDGSAALAAAAAATAAWNSTLQQ